ncbi:MAG: type II secretion system F family protein, partial [Candidatus Absconditabacteria bacterium]
TYPTILLAMSAGAIVVLLLFVIPTVVGMFPAGNALPGITVFMINASDFLKDKWPVILIIAGSLYAGYTLSYKYLLPFKIIVDKLMVIIPVVSDVTKTFYMYKFSTVLGQLYSGGISPVISLHLISEIFENYHYKKKVLEIESDLKSGFSMAESMDGSDLFDPILIQIIHVGEETGNMADVLTKISGFYHDILGDKIDALLAMIEPILMIFLAAIIGSVVGAVFIPMADMVNVVG